MNLIRLLRTKRERSKSNNNIKAKDKSIAGIDNNGNQIADTIINNTTNPNDARVKLTLELNRLIAEKQKWIDDETAKHGLFGSTGMVMRDINRKAACRYDERIKSLEKALNALPFSQ